MANDNDDLRHFRSTLFTALEVSDVAPDKCSPYVQVIITILKLAKYVCRCEWVPRVLERGEGEEIAKAVPSMPSRMCPASASRPGSRTRRASAEAFDVEATIEGALSRRGALAPQARLRGLTRRDLSGRAPTCPREPSPGGSHRREERRGGFASRVAGGSHRRGSVTRVPRRGRF